MEIDSQNAIWGLGFAATIYLLGNGIWVNDLARSRAWLGWLMWLALAVIMIISAAAIELYISTSDTGILDLLGSRDKESYWIAVSLLALMSVPGATSVIFRQPRRWTLLALILPACIVFIPAAVSMSTSAEKGLLLGIGIALILSTLLFLWQRVFDQKISA
ncbi:MAG: hypothetical protein R8M38_05075 [Mariprofundaceae bacterium]